MAQAVARLPDRLNGIKSDLRVGRDDGKILGEGLRNEDSIKRVFVVQGKGRNSRLCSSSTGRTSRSCSDKTLRT